MERKLLAAALLSLSLILGSADSICRLTASANLRKFPIVRLRLARAGRCKVKSRAEVRTVQPSLECVSAVVARVVEKHPDCIGARPCPLDFREQRLRGL